MSLAALSGFVQGFAGSRKAKQARQDRKDLNARLDKLIGMGGLGAMGDGGSRAAGGTTQASMNVPLGATWDGDAGDRPRMAFEYFTGKEVPSHVAAGIVGNMMQESGPEIDTGAIGDNGNAFGSVQWNGPRRRAYLAYAADRGVDPRDFQTQLDYQWHEWQTSEKGAYDAVMQAKTAEEAALIASDRFWRPGVPHNANRAAFANRVYSQFGGPPTALGVGPG